MILKDPQAEQTYYIDWSEWLAGVDTVASATWDVPAGLTQVGVPTNSDTHCFIKLSGGTLGEAYNVTCHMVTTNGEKEDHTLTFWIKEK